MIWVKLENNFVVGVIRDIDGIDYSQYGMVSIPKADYELALQGCLYDQGSGQLISKQHFTIDNIPLPATATIEGDQYELTEQPTFEFSEPGQYEVTIDAGPAYYVETFTVDYPPSS